jgi:predicted nuclease of predicted toxin-antitoxin system
VKRLYADENFPVPAVEELRRLGHDVLTSHEAGKSGRAVPDEEVLAFALENDRALLTLNRRHFVRLHEVRQDHAGIVVCSVDPDFISMAARVHEAIESTEILRGCLVRVNRVELARRRPSVAGWGLAR